MIEKPMPQDVLKFKTKFVAGLTLRQCIFLLLCGIVALFSYFFLFEGIQSGKIKIFCTALTVVPFGIVGFIEIMGQPFEVLAKDMLIDNFIAPAVRKKEYRHPELEKWEKDITNTYLNEEKVSDPKNKNNSNQIKIKKSKEYPGIK